MNGIIGIQQRYIASIMNTAADLTWKVKLLSHTSPLELKAIANSILAYALGTISI